MSQQPKYLSDAGRALQALLDPNDPAFSGCDEVREALNDGRLRNYLQSWVMPTVNALANDDWPKWLKEANKVRAAHARNLVSGVSDKPAAFVKNVT
jgi:hypothetical protein